MWLWIALRIRFSGVWGAPRLQFSIYKKIFSKSPPFLKKEGMESKLLCVSKKQAEISRKKVLLELFTGILSDFFVYAHNNYLLYCMD